MLLFWGLARYTGVWRDEMHSLRAKDFKIRVSFFFFLSLLPLAKEGGYVTTTTMLTKKSQICIFNAKKTVSFAHFARVLFSFVFVHFEAVLVQSTACFTVVWATQGLGYSTPTNLIKGSLVSQTAWNNRETIAGTRSYIFRWSSHCRRCRPCSKFQLVFIVILLLFFLFIGKKWIWNHMLR